MAKPACKCKPAHCEECPEWIFTFADLVMLMMGFFVILWVLKPAPGKQASGVEDDQMIKVLASIRDYFNFVPDSTNPDKVDLYRLLKKVEDMKPLKDPGDGGRTKLDKKGVEGINPEVEIIRPSKQVGTGAKVLFAPAQAALSDAARSALDEIAQVIRGHRNIFMVKGHTSTDDYPEGAADNVKMDLSIRRAQAAADYLVTKGVDRETIRVQGCSTYEPIVQRAYTGDTRSVNRRVEVEATGTLVKDMQDNSTSRPQTLPMATTKPPHAAH